MKVIILLLAVIISNKSFAEMKLPGTVIEEHCSTRQSSNDGVPLTRFCFASIVGEIGNYVTFYYPMAFISRTVGRIVEREQRPVYLWSTHTKEELTIQIIPGDEEIKIMVTKDLHDPEFAIVEGTTPFAGTFSAHAFEFMDHTM